MFKLPVICGSARLESSEVPVGAVGTKLLHSPPGQIHQMPQILQTPQMPMSGMSGLLPPGVGVSVEVEEVMGHLIIMGHISKGLLQGNTQSIAIFPTVLLCHWLMRYIP